MGAEQHALLAAVVGHLELAGDEEVHERRRAQRLAHDALRLRRRERGVQLERARAHAHACLPERLGQQRLVARAGRHRDLEAARAVDRGGERLAVPVAAGRAGRVPAVRQPLVAEQLVRGRELAVELQQHFGEVALRLARALREFCAERVDRLAQEPRRARRRALPARALQGLLGGAAVGGELGGRHAERRHRRQHVAARVAIARARDLERRRDQGGEFAARRAAGLRGQRESGRAQRDPGDEGGAAHARRLLASSTPSTAPPARAARGMLGGGDARRVACGKNEP